MELNVSENTFLCQDLLLKNLFSDLSIKKWLQRKLYAVASSLNRESQNISNSNELLLNFTASDISLSPLKSHIGYRCAIALQLARQQDFSSLIIAEQIGANLKTICPEFTILVKDSGWIEFQVSDRALAIWLQPIFQKISCPKKELLKEIVPNLFAIQYTHARCCSLLRLGEREELIQLDEILKWKHPYPISWLDEKDNFRLIHPIEKNLIGQFLEVVDALDRNKTDWNKLATQLSKAVLECDRDCRIFGDVKRNNRELSQARLGLYAIARLLLQKLLEEKLGIWAPIEL